MESTHIGLSMFEFIYLRVRKKLFNKRLSMLRNGNLLYMFFMGSDQKATVGS